MASLLSPPTPPKSTLSSEEQIQTFSQMLKSLEESAKYQEEAIKYHTESLKVLKEESKNTKSQLDLCRNTIEILLKTQKSASSKGAKDGRNSGKVVIEKKAKSTSKKKSSRVESKKKQDAKQEKKTTVKQIKGKKRSALSSSSVLDKYKNITAMVLDFVQKKKGGVVGVSEIIEYVYPKGGLSESEKKRAYNSFSKALSESMKKGILERTVPGKYRWIGK